MVDDAWYLALLQTAPPWRENVLRKLTEQEGSARQAWKASRRDLFLSGLFTAEEAASFCLFREQTDAEACFAAWERQGLGCLSLASPAYPPLLRHVHHPPQVLFVRGRPEALPPRCVAIVGSRKASPYGRNVAELLAGELAQAGIGIVSGAARGIDTAAHRGCLRQQGYTAAILGCGIDVAYPPENRPLLQEIVAAGGCVLSEYAPGTPPRAGQFPARNRIIAGMTAAVVVVEAAERSGALITAELALDEGRDVLAVPGSIFADGSPGPHRLLRQGAALVASGADVLRECGWDAACTALETACLETEEEKKAWNLLSCDGLRHIDELAAAGDLSWEQLQYALLCLELKGLVRKEGQRYGRTAKEGIW